MLLATAIVVLLGLGGYQAVRYRAFAEMKSAVQRETFYEGTTVEGIDVSSMTLAQAMEYWQENIEPAYSQRKVTLSNGASFTAEELGYTSDYATVLSNAFSAGRTGSLEQRYAAAVRARRSAPVSYRLRGRATIRRPLPDACPRSPRPSTVRRRTRRLRPSTRRAMNLPSPTR